MIGTLMGMCIIGMFLVGVLIPFGMLIYGVVVAIKDQIEINRLLKWVKGCYLHVTTLEIHLPRTLNRVYYLLKT